MLVYANETVEENAENYLKFSQQLIEQGLPKEDGLQDRLDYLATYAIHEQDGDPPDKTITILHPDFAPLSFTFGIYAKANPGKGYNWSEHAGLLRNRPELEGYTMWFNGGLIYHGSHDGYGSGSAPTFSVTLTKTRGWSIHT